MWQSRLFAGLVVLCGLAGAALAPAQGQPPPNPARPVDNLAQILEEVDWDPAERGALLIVAPAKTVRYNPPPRVENGRPTFAQPAQLPPGRNGYLLANVGDYFSRRMIACNTVSVFAPQTMGVLNTRLPKPDIYADMSPGERLNLFRASLTQQQWQRLNTPEGLGVSDLSGAQRDLFLAVIPDPFPVYRVTGGENGGNRTLFLQLAGAQRAQVRLSLRQRIQWSYRTGDNGSLSVGVGNGLSPGQERLETTYMGTRFSGRNGPMTMFGATVLEDVRARPKPGDLPFDWNGLDPIISLREVKTLGALIERIRAVTRVEIYADRRYADLPLYLRGESARAGDLLKAVSLAVTGTYRKVGPAYVLTDDREGLGTRQAIQQQWAWLGTTLLTDLHAAVTRNVRKLPKSQAAWDADDLNAPDNALKEKVAAFRARQAALKPEERYRPENSWLMVPVSEMPATAQESIRKEVAYIEGDFRRNNPQPVRTDAVIVHTRTTLVAVLPDGRTLEMQMGGMDLSSFGNEEATGTPPPPPTSMTLPNGFSRRVLVVAPATADEAKQAVTMARARGFTTVWVAVCPGEIALVEAAVAAGKNAGIPVGALVHVLRAGASTAAPGGNSVSMDLPPDINLLGETQTLAARRQTREPMATAAAAGMFGYYVDREDPTAGARARADQNLARTARWGDWLRCDLPEVRAMLMGKVSAIAKVPGLAGIALTDLAPPGYAVPSRYAVGSLPAILFGFGYTEEMRLDFLRKYQVDPIDLSPLEGGRLITRTGWFVNNSLPFFPDFGLTGKYANGNSIHNGVDTYEMGARDAAEKWLEYRASISRDFSLTLMRSLRAAAPAVPLYAYHLGAEDYPYDMRWAAELSETPKAPDLLAPPLVARQPWPPNRGEGDSESSAPSRRQKTFADQLKENARQVMLVCLYRAGLPVGDARFGLIQQTRAALSISGTGWDGLVLDLSDVPLETSSTLLEAVKMPEAVPK